MICPHCGGAKLQVPPDNHASYLVCPSCHAMTLKYNPQWFQSQFHVDPSRYKMFAGGFGSGKSRTTTQEVLMLALENPETVGLMTAQTLPQLRDTSMKIFLQDVLPPPLIKDYRIQENKHILVNGTEILWRPSDDEGKLRSLNLGFFHIEEASEVKHAIFIQLQTRLRNDRMRYHRGLLSTNPDLGWVRSEFLMKSAHIYNSDVEYYIKEDEKNPNFSTHIAATRLNKYLQPNYVEDLARGKPSWWVERYLEGSFAHTSGAVYQGFSKTIIPPFTIPQHWNHYRVGADHGLRNPTAVLFMAINPMKESSDKDKPLVVIYDEYYKPNTLLPEHAEAIKSKVGRIPYGALQAMKIDPSTRNRQPETGRSILDYYREHGLYFQPANNDLDYGLAKVNTYIESGALKIFNTCVNTIEEGINYKYPEQDLYDEKNADEKPKKVNDHAMDALRYIIADLPDNPNDLYALSYTPSYIYSVAKDGELKKSPLPFALQDDEPKYGDWTSFV